MIDYHIHPDYSIDAEPFSMSNYCEQALKLGLREICFTTHCEFDPLRRHLDWFVRTRGQVVPMHPATWLDYYFREIADCAKLYATSGLEVKAGLEAGYDLGLEREIEKVITGYPFDFVIGSVHCLDHIAISSGHESAGYFRGKQPKAVAEAYFRTLLEAIKTGLFDVVGHLDIYRRHGSNYLDQSINYFYTEYIEDVLAAMRKKGTGLELNTSSWRHGQGEFYPDPAIITAAVKAGIENFTVGSDCHRISELGQGIAQAMSIAEKAGVRFSVYKDRHPKKI